MKLCVVLNKKVQTNNIFPVNLVNIVIISMAANLNALCKIILWLWIFIFSKLEKISKIVTIFLAQIFLEINFDSHQKNANFKKKICNKKFVAIFDCQNIKILNQKIILIFFNSQECVQLCSVFKFDANIYNQCVLF